MNHAIKACKNMQNRIHIRYKKLLNTFSREGRSRCGPMRVVLRIEANNHPFSVLQGKGCLGLKSNIRGKGFPALLHEFLISLHESYSKQ